MQKRSQRGFLLIEGLIAASLTSIVVGAIAGIYLSTSQIHELEIQDAQMLMLAHEGISVARSIRDSDSENFPVGTFGLATTTGTWEFSGSSDTYNGFVRSVGVSAVDTDTFQVVSSVSANLRTKSLTTYLSRWREVVASVIGDWSSPTEDSAFDLPGNDNGVKVAIAGDYAYVVRSGGGTNFYVVDISNTSSPTIVGTESLSTTLQNIAVSGNYAYVVSSANSKELMIVDISTPSSPVEVGSYNAAGNQNGRGVFAVGTTVYIVLDDGGNDELVIVDASTPASPTKIGGEDLNDDGNEVYVSGNYAYIATDGDELEIVDVSNPASPNSVYELNFSGNDNGISIAGAGSMVYVGRSNGEIELVEVSTPTAPIWRGTFDADDDARDIVVGNEGNYLFVASDENDAEFQIVDVSDFNDPELVGSVNVSSDLTGVAYDSTRDIAVLVGEDNDPEMYIYSSN